MPISPRTAPACFANMRPISASISTIFPKSGTGSGPIGQRPPRKPAASRRSHMLAKDIMTRKVKTIHSTNSIRTAIELMIDQSVSGLPVVDEDDVLIGMITEGDCWFPRGTEPPNRLSSAWKPTCMASSHRTARR
ncbi:MAG: hypothetical protein DI537_45460 [Stutzerimonas stutzeri]|nr:MAG: hypothetical protein DI537_45460 [Stutzerimonas stutzeri]